MMPLRDGPFPSAAKSRFPRRSGWMHLAFALACFFLLSGFIQVHDEVTVRGSGGAVVHRTVRSSAAEDLEKLLDRLREEGKIPTEDKRQIQFRESMQAAIQEAPTGIKGGWDSAWYEGATLHLKKSYSMKKSPFSSAEKEQATFALHHFLSNPITRPPFPLMGTGPIQQSDAEHAAFIRDLQGKGYRLDLTVHMPGKIFYRWGDKVRDGADTVGIDLLEPWPEERTETFLMSDRGLLHREWLHLLLVGILFLALFIWMRSLRR